MEQRLYAPKTDLLPIGRNFDRIHGNLKRTPDDRSWPDSDLSLIGASRPKAEVASQSRGPSVSS
jgi:hypothetical protein